MSQFIAIEGNIGAGKTTLATLLAERLNARLMLEEFAENPFLAHFYDNPDRYSFSLEMSFLADRYHQLKSMMREDLFQPRIISDYSLYKSLIFAQNNLKDNELDLYRNLFNIMAANLKQPDLVIFLNRSYDTLRKHIRQRGRSYEQGIELEYLMNIQKNYSRFFKQKHDVPVLVLDADNYDFLNRPQDVTALEDILSQEMPEGLNFIS